MGGQSVRTWDWPKPGVGLPLQAKYDVGSKPLLVAGDSPNIRPD